MAKDLKQSIEDEIQKMLKAKESPDEGRMKLLNLGIKMCALNAKLEEDQYGGFFNAGESGSVQEQPNGEKPPARKRANGAGSGELDLDT